MHATQRNSTKGNDQEKSIIRQWYRVPFKIKNHHLQWERCSITRAHINSSQNSKLAAPHINRWNEIVCCSINVMLHFVISSCVCVRAREHASCLSIKIFINMYVSYIRCCSFPFVFAFCFVSLLKIPNVVDFTICISNVGEAPPQQQPHRHQQPQQQHTHTAAAAASIITPTHNQSVQY